MQHVRFNKKLSYKAHYQPFQDSKIHIVRYPYTETMHFLKSPK